MIHLASRLRTILMQTMAHYVNPVAAMDYTEQTEEDGQSRQSS